MEVSRKPQMAGGSRGPHRTALRRYRGQLHGLLEAIHVAVIRREHLQLVR